MDSGDRAWRSGPVVMWVLVLVALILAPLLRPGYLLRSDMVSTPRQYLVPDAWGVGDAVPRSVPMDALMALVTTVVDGGLVVRLALAAALVLAGLGAARLVPGSRLVRAGAATLAIWNPYVAERLLMGNWALLLAYGALPWAIGAALDLRRGVTGAGWRVVAWLAPTALTPPGAVLGAIAVLPVVAWPGGLAWVRRTALAFGVVLLVNLPWLVPALVHPSRGLSDATAVEVFAARADTSLGLWGSLLGLGGIWNSESVPASRQAPVAVALTVLLVAVAVPGALRLRRFWGGGLDALVAASLLGVLVAGWGATSPDSLASAVATVPGLGLLRDGHRFVAPLAVLLACAAPTGVAVVGRRLLTPEVGRLVGAGLLLVPLAVLPDLAWGGAGRLDPVRYPSDWPEVRRALADQPDDADVVSLPWQALRRYAWNDGRSAVDPLPRFLDRTVVASSDLVVGTEDGPVTVSGENARAQRVGRLLASGRPMTLTLPEEGIGWVVVQKDTPGDVSAELLEGADLVLERDHLALYRVVPEGAAPRGSSASPWSPVVVGVDLAVAAAVGAAVAVSWLRRRTAATVTLRP